MESTIEVTEGPFVEELVHVLRAQNAIFVAGTGVSTATTQQPVTSWTGLLESGVKRCLQNYPDLAATDWAARRLADAHGDLDEMLLAADDIVRKLGRCGDFRSWLCSALERLPIVDDTLIKELAAFELPIATTNYDHLLEEVTGLPAVTADAAQVVDVLSGKGRGIIHLHGHFLEPATIVLTSASYEAFRANVGNVASLQFMTLFKRLVFVGFGAGMKDPNFSALIDWTVQVFRNATEWNFQLVRKADLAAARASLPAHSRVRVINYGEKYSDLPAFLRWLRGQAPIERIAAPASVATDDHPWRPSSVATTPQLSVTDPSYRQFVGRESVLDDFRRTVEGLRNGAGAIADGTATRVLWIYGFGGMGKSWFVKRACIEASDRHGGAVNATIVDWDPGPWSLPLTSVPYSALELFNALAHRVARAYTIATLDPYWQALSLVEDGRVSHADLTYRFDAALTALQQFGPDWRSETVFSRFGSEAAKMSSDSSTRRDIFNLEEALRSHSIWNDSVDVLTIRLGDLTRNRTLATELFETWARRIVGSDAEPLVTPERVLADALITALERACREKPLILALDTCELLSEELDAWLRYVITRLVMNEARFVVLIGSRLKPDALQRAGSRNTWRSQISGGRLRFEAFDETRLFTVDEVGEVLRASGAVISPDPELVEAVHRVTLGVPLAVRVLLDEHETGSPVLSELKTGVDTDSFHDLADATRIVTQRVAQRFLLHLQEKPEAAEDFRDIIAIAIQRVPDERILSLLWNTHAPRERLRELVRRYSILSGGDLHPAVRTYVRPHWREEPPPPLNELARQLRELHRTIMPSNQALDEFTAWLTEDLNLASWVDAAEAGRLFPGRVAIYLALKLDVEPLRELFEEMKASTQIDMRPIARLEPLLSGRWSYDPLTHVTVSDIAWFDARISDEWTPLETASLDLIAGMTFYEARDSVDGLNQPARLRFENAIRYFGDRLPRASTVVSQYAFTSTFGEGSITNANRETARSALTTLRESNVLRELDTRSQAKLLLFAGDSRIAAEMWRSEMPPDSAEDNHILGHMYSNWSTAPDDEAAIAAFQKSVDIQPKVLRYWGCLIKTKQRVGILDAAAATNIATGLLAANADRDLSAEDGNSLAWTLYQLNRNLDRAEKHAETALEERPGDLNIMHTLAAIQIRRDRWTEAASTLKRLLETENPDSPKLAWDAIHQIVRDALAQHPDETVALLTELRNADGWGPMIRAAEELGRHGDGSFPVLAAADHEVVIAHYNALRTGEPPSR